MQSFPFELEHYVTIKGKKPFKDWLDGLKDVSARAKIRVRLDRVRLGNMGDARSVGEGVSELKVDYGPGYRIYFSREGDRIVLLLLGGVKARQAKDIIKAKEFYIEHKRRQTHG
jgi:putative addiction module killer protein